MSEDAVMTDAPSADATASTLTLIRNYDPLKKLQDKPRNDKFKFCDRVRLNITLADLDPSWSTKDDAELTALSPEITAKFSNIRGTWAAALRASPDSTRIRELRLRFEERLVRSVTEIMVGFFIRAVTSVIWEAVGYKKEIKVVIEGCEDMESRKRLTGSVEGFDAYGEP